MINVFYGPHNVELTVESIKRGFFMLVGSECGNVGGCSDLLLRMSLSRVGVVVGVSGVSRAGSQLGWVHEFLLTQEKNRMY